MKKSFRIIILSFNKPFRYGNIINHLFFTCVLPWTLHISDVIVVSKVWEKTKTKNKKNWLWELPGWDSRSNWVSMPMSPSTFTITMYAHFPPQSCFFKPKCLSPASAMSNWVQLLISHPNHASSSLGTCLPPLLCLFESKHSFSTPCLSPGTYLSHQSCPFKLKCLSPILSMFLRAWILVFHPDHVSHLSFTSTMSL